MATPKPFWDDGIDEAREILRDHSPLITQALAKVLSRYEPPPAPVVQTSPIEPFRRYRGREGELVVDVFGQKLWEFQRWVFQQLEERQFVAVSAGRKASKTETGAGVVASYVLSHESTVLTTAPFGKQVEMQLWQRVHKLWQAAIGRGMTLPGKLNSDSLWIGPEHYAVGMTTATRAGAQSAAGFAGWHAGVVVPDDPDAPMTEDELHRLRERADAMGARRLVVVVDEATNVDPAVFNALQGSFSGPNVRVLLLMNATRDTDDPHPAVRAFANGSRYARARVTVLDEADDPEPDEGTSSDIGFDRVFRVPEWLRDRQWVEDCRKEWHRNGATPLWHAFVTGRPPSTSVEERFVTRAALEDCIRRYEAGDQYGVQFDPRPGKHMGVDVARSTKGDETVASLVDHGVLVAQHKWRVADTMKTADTIDELATEWGEKDKPLPGRNIHVDVIGVGGGVVDRLRQKGIRVDAVDVGSKPLKDWPRLVRETEFNTRKAELHWIVRRAAEEGLAVIPKEYVDTFKEAQWTRYELVRGGGQTVVAVHKEDDKDGLRARYGRSPDHWDSYMLSFSRVSGEPDIRIVSARRGIRGVREILRGQRKV